MFRDTLELTAPTVGEAKQLAMETLGVSDPSELVVEVLYDAKAALFSFDRKPSRIRVTRSPEGFGHVARTLADSIPELPPSASKGAAAIRLSPGTPTRRRNMPKPDIVIEEATPAPSVSQMGIEPSKARPRDAYDATPEDNESFEKVVDELLEAMDLDCEVEFEHGDYQRVFVTLADREAGLLIGRRGAGVDALEHVLARMVSHRAGHAVPVQADVNDYRRREHEKLEHLATSLAEEALRTGEEIHLEPMNPRDRRVVHLAAKRHDGITTYTVGEGPRRHVVIVRGEASG